MFGHDEDGGDGDDSDAGYIEVVNIELVLDHRHGDEIVMMVRR